jgi:carbonic anhydrase
MQPKLSRRSLLHATAAASAMALLPHGPAFALSGGGTALTADQALALLKKGNADFVAGRIAAPNAGVKRRAEIAAKQTPFCAVLACADSRVPPELLFNRGLGDLFVVRVAGNTLDPEGLGSLEYGVEHLGIPLILVLGHERCGAVGAAVEVVEKNARLPGSLNAIVEPIVPAVLRAKAGGGDLLANAVRENVLGVVGQLTASDSVMTGPIARGELTIAGAVYDLDTGAVDFIA